MPEGCADGNGGEFKNKDYFSVEDYEASDQGNEQEETAEQEPEQSADNQAAEAQEPESQEDAEQEADYQQEEYDQSEDEELLLTERPVSNVRIENVQVRLDTRKPIEFGAKIGKKEEQDDQVEILFEQWSDGTDVITSDDPREPIPDSTYHYILALRTKDGYVFPNHFDVLYKGASVGHSVMISLDRKIAMVSWGLSVNTSRGIGLRSPLTLVRKS